MLYSSVSKLSYFSALERSLRKSLEASCLGLKTAGSMLLLAEDLIVLILLNTCSFVICKSSGTSLSFLEDSSI
jgi:hypothetical protein